MVSQAGRQYIVDSFPDGTLRITEIYNINTKPSQKKETNKKGFGETDPDLRLASSVARSKKAVYDIVHCMKIEWFITFTFALDNKYCNPYDKADCKDFLGEWFQNLKKKYPNNEIQYIAIPEWHEQKEWEDSSRIHFHCVCSGIPEKEFKYSGVIQRHRKVYNLLAWKAGFTNCTKASSPQKAANYMLKYVTKNLCADPEDFNKQRYLVSKNIPRPERIYNQFISGIQSMFQNPEDCIMDSGEFLPDIDELANSVGDYVRSFDAPIDIVKEKFEYHAHRYYYKLKEKKNDY